ncbi:hypothetical protein K1718_27475 (plasmid) [Roseibium porphyridii]|uniref:Uncharacterized protein n=1 Tax=Roseibium porphyridii TaxID=2866279 RepID=A0ABY8FJB9_9HYPH|nr:hypothetical protein [Roseibium sp. KMA01]WFE92643.1 hypothetical protein K1718_27475 [Roseibium sp. KMA01]
MAKSDMDKDPEQERSSLGKIIGDLAKEFGWAMRDMRSELIDNMWFGRNSWPQEKEPFDFYSTKKNADKEPDTPELQREDLYGHPDWDNVRDIEQHEHRDALGESMWESYKEKAQALYGHDQDRDREKGHDIDR